MSSESKIRYWSAVVLLALSQVLAGCGAKPSPDLIPVTGVVTFDGQPVVEGFISFEDQAGNFPPESGRIAEGKYRLEARPGKAIVRVTASRQVGNQDPNSPNPPQWIDYVPTKYNINSDLTANVESNGNNRFDFSLVR